MKFAKFISVSSSRAAALLCLAVEHRDPPKMKPFVAVPVRAPTDSAQTKYESRSRVEINTCPLFTHDFETTSGVAILSLWTCPISVFWSRKFQRSSNFLQVLGRDEGPGSSKENLVSSWKLDSRPVQEANIPQAVFVRTVSDHCLFDQKNFCVATFDGVAA